MAPDVRCAIVGSGLAGFSAYLALQDAGLGPDEIVVLGADPDPTATFGRRAAAIRQRQMRSESDGHCRPRTFPGLAVASARRRRSLAPLVASACDRYRPTVAEFLDDCAAARERSGWERSFRPRRVGHVRAVADGFDVDGVGARHVLIATGHPALRRPPELAADPRVVHAYEPHDYAPSVCVVGAGMAAATEWRNALAAGAVVSSVRRREPARRPLNVPRPLFSRRGLRGYHRLGPADRDALLARLGEPSYPSGAAWDRLVAAARRDCRFRIVEAPRSEHQIVCATGFERGFDADPLLRTLVADHDLATVGGRIVLDADASVPALTDRTRTLALSGVAAQWAFPAADTLAGFRYVGHRFGGRVLRCPPR